MLAGTRGQRAYRVAVYPLAQAPGEESALLLVDDQTDLVSLDRARKEFLSSVSHELRTPLASIKLMLETVLGSPDEEAARFVLAASAGAGGSPCRFGAAAARTSAHRVGTASPGICAKSIWKRSREPIVASFEPVAANKGVELDLHVLASGGRRGRPGAHLTSVRESDRQRAPAYARRRTRQDLDRRAGCGSSGGGARYRRRHPLSGLAAHLRALLRRRPFADPRDAAERAWALRSSRASWTRTAGPSRPNPCWGAAPRSPSGCRSCAFAWVRPNLKRAIIAT